MASCTSVVCTCTTLQARLNQFRLNLLVLNNQLYPAFVSAFPMMIVTFAPDGVA